MEYIRLPLPPALVGISRTERCDRTRDVVSRLTALSPASDLQCAVEQLQPVVRDIRAKWAASSVPAGGEQSEFDNYFRVQRVDAPNCATALCEALTVAYYELLVDSNRGSTLLPLELGHLVGIAERLLCVFGNADPSPTSILAGVVQNSEPDRCTVDAMRRWLTGHHMFFVLVQSLIVVHHWLEAALREERLHDAREALVIATDLWWACAAAFRFAGDFSAQAYRDTVRPSMSPPYVSDGFSGSLFADHSYLLRRLKAMRPQLEHLPCELRQLHRQYLIALDSMYSSHGFVCERFVGTAASLRDSARGLEWSAAAVVRGRLRRRAVYLAGGNEAAREDDDMACECERRIAAP